MTSSDSNNPPRKILRGRIKRAVDSNAIHPVGTALEYEIEAEFSLCHHDTSVLVRLSQTLYRAIICRECHYEQAMPLTWHCSGPVVLKDGSVSQRRPILIAPRQNQIASHRNQNESP